MENTIRLILLIIGIFIILVILWDGLRRQKQQKNFLNKKLKSVQDQVTDIFHVAPEQALAVADMPLSQPVSFEEAPAYAEELSLTTDQEETDLIEEPIEQEKVNQVIMFSFIAPAGQFFGGFKLLHTLNKQGFKFGEMNLFHFYDDPRTESYKLFSLAAATESGQFDLTNMANFACKGLVLFMNTEEHDNPAGVFDDMVDQAEKLAEELSADLKIGTSQAWTDENLARIYETLI